MPGQPGTKKLVEKYGETLFCVRYRYDMNQGKKLKTVEIIVEESPWEVNSKNIPGNKLVKIRVDYDEVYLRRLVKSAGGRWDKEEKVWELPYREVKDLGLEKRMVKV